jgi:hypothetical protein
MVTTETQKKQQPHPRKVIFRTDHVIHQIILYGKWSGSIMDSGYCRQTPALRFLRLRIQPIVAKEKWRVADHHHISPLK